MRLMADGAASWRLYSALRLNFICADSQYSMINLSGYVPSVQSWLP